MTMKYLETLACLQGLYHQPHRSTEAVGLARAERLLRELGNPHRAFQAVHIAGSTGKGSTSTMIAHILQAAGFRTGLFRSPHLHDYTERLRIGQRDISRAEWELHFSVVWPIVERMRDNDLRDYDYGRPSHFEVLFALCALYFADQGVEWAAIETGMGGRLDATNTLDSQVAVVTNVSLEHTHVLGNTEQQIAGEKAAIIKNGSHGVTAATGAALDVIRMHAERVNSPLLEIPRHVRVRTADASLRGQRLALECGGKCVVVDLPLAGRFQAVNAATAYAGVLALRGRGVHVPDAAVERGLASVRMPGRLEIIGERPRVVVDGAHSAAGSAALAEALELEDTGGRRVLVFAAMNDKDIAKMAHYLAPTADLVVVTAVPDTDRSASPQEVAATFAGLARPVIVEPDPDRAMARGLSLVSPEDTVVVAGSLYLVGRARRALSPSPVM